MRQGKDVSIFVDNQELKGFLHLKEESKGLIIFAHGSGSGRYSSRNQFVAGVFQASGLGTLLFDLLSEDEEIIDNRTRHLRFDIPLLASRLGLVTDWALNSYQPKNKRLKLGYFGASTGAGAALIAAAEKADVVDAVVSRGGRPDLAQKYLPLVEATTLLIVGERDQQVLELNESALARMTNARTELRIIPHASHLFEEEGALEQVAELARDFFMQQFSLSVSNSDRLRGLNPLHRSSESTGGSV